MSIATRQPPEFLSKISAGATQSVGLALLLAPLLLGGMGQSRAGKRRLPAGDSPAGDAGGVSGVKASAVRA